MTMPKTLSEPLRILLVEDCILTLNLTKRMLHDLGITQVFTAQNGVEGLNLLGTSDGEDIVDLVLCDWNMPEMSGMELLRQVRTCDPNLMFYMITGQADRASIAEAKAFGVNGFIRKPFSADELGKKLSVASRVIAHRKLDSIAS